MWSFIRNLTPRKNVSLIIVAAFLSVGAFATIINVLPAQMADANHGAVTWSGGVATVTDLVCTSCVNATDLATGSVQPDEIQNNAVREAGLDNTLCLHVLASSATNPTELNATPNFLDLVDGAGSETENNEDNYLMFAAQNMTVNNLRCVSDTAPGVGKDQWTIAVRVGAIGSLSDTAVTCAIDEANVDCTDITNSAAVTKGQAITIGINSVGADNIDASGDIRCAICLGT